MVSRAHFERLISHLYRSESEHKTDGCTNKMIFYDSLKRRKSIREREGSQQELQRPHSGDTARSAGEERYEWPLSEITISISVQS